MSAASGNAISLPPRLNELLGTDHALAGGVHAAIADFSPWFTLSGMPFFPYYTDHGPAHINGVLLSCEALINEESWEILTPADAAVLILSTLLHDSALHLREEGFIALVSGGWGTVIHGFSDEPWPTLWSEFLAESRRWDAKQLVRIFGTADPAQVPDLSRSSEWTQRDRLLIGEFLRRFHHRIAHEIAFEGVPGPHGGTQIQLSAGLGEFLSMAGVVARSHGMELRSCLPYLESNLGSIREFRGAHAVYLMAVLRVADYLQIQPERAPKQLLSVAIPRSPFSRGEWEAHGAVRDITSITEDPEALLLIAKPQNIRTFLRLRGWLTGIQSEMDQSWAVLGEVYGRFPPLNRLGIAIRRIKSNLDDIAAFSLTVPYVPVAASFSTAEADLLKLLVSPLYGDRPEIGIRELLQNAVDAVREREVLLSSDDVSHSNTTDGTPEVRVELLKDDTGAVWLEVEDRGIGMTAQVVRDYFLKAGASFRFSDAWRRSFEMPNGDSRVIRSGRFGVGAVAAFLLGDEIEVITRHVQASPQDGVSFRAHLEDDSVELRKVECSSGTTVRVRLRTSAITRFDFASRTALLPSEWDWYFLALPSVRRIVFGVPIKGRYSLPLPDSTLPAPWHRVTDPQFQDIHWTFAPAPGLVCNGIPIMSEIPYYPYTYHEQELPAVLFEPVTKHYRFYYPALSVFDPNGHLPLNLQRTGLVQDRYPFSSELLTSVLHNFIADFVVSAPERRSSTQDGVLEHGSWRYEGIRM